MLALLAEHERIARERLPAAVYDYFAGGSGDEISLQEASPAWSRYRLRPRTLVDVSAVRTDTTVLGRPVRLPVLVAPVAFQTLAHPEGETGCARGAAEAGSVFLASTRSVRPLEEVAAAARGWWFQVYVLRDRGATDALVDRAVAAGAGALVLTADTPYVGRKRRGDAALPLPALSREFDLEQDPSVGVSELEALVARSPVPVVVKGVLRGDDAARWAAAGAAGIVVSNHGGRQLDRAVASADALPEVVAAVAGRAEVYADGGIRSGLDVLVALALGARAVLVGRPAVWALAAGGAPAVHAALEALRSDLEHVLALAGAPDPGHLPANLVRLPQ